MCKDWEEMRIPAAHLELGDFFNGEQVIAINRLSTIDSILYLLKGETEMRLLWGRTMLLIERKTEGCCENC